MEEEKTPQSQDTQADTKPRSNKFSHITKYLLIIVVIIILAAIGYFYWLNKISFSYSNQPSQTKNQAQNPPATEALSPTASEGESNIPSAWLTYKNEKYRFEISYPSTYKALTDKENLYGWPNAVVLIYSGGQSYDLPIEVWDSKAEYQAKYKNTSNLTVKELNGKFITLLNTNFKDEVDEIINTFKPL